MLADLSEEDCTTPPALQPRPEENDALTNHRWEDKDDMCSDSDKMSIEVPPLCLNAGNLEVGMVCVPNSQSAGKPSQKLLP